MKAPPAAGDGLISAAAITFFFAAFYLALFSSLPVKAEYLAPVLIGMAFSAAYCVFKRKKYVKYIILGVAAAYTAICVAVDFGAFVGGAAGSLNDAARTANANMHWGFGAFSAEYSVWGGFAFSSVISVWLGLATAAVGRSRILIPFSAAVVVLWVLLGLYPAWWAAVALAVSYALLCVAEKGLDLKSAGAYALCAVVLFTSAAGCFFYGGSSAVRGAREATVSAFNRVLYGGDSLPEGDLERSAGMNSGEDIRLEISLTSQVRNLYLKGFSGGELSGAKWAPTDRNAYVEDGYQGLLDYVAADGIPFTQFARYTALNGGSDRYGITVKNVGANGKYVYSPYTAERIDAGSPYYDSTVRANIFTSKTYSYQAYSRNRNCEWISQAQWLNPSAQHTAEMRAYISYEGQYRAFVSDIYRKIDEDKLRAVSPHIVEVGSPTVNTVTQLIRRYFLDNFIYSDVPDKTGEDFVSDFFGGNIERANAAYFASAAVYMYRAYGLAARYAEGYYIRTEKVLSTSEITATGRNSHAWAEVYFDGIGWLPIETTPTFFSEEDMEKPPLPDVDNKPDEPTSPEIPPEKPDDEKPEDPDTDKQKLTPSEKALLISLKVLLPVLCVALAVTLIMLSAQLKRFAVLRKKRKMLQTRGEAFGRAAYTIISRDFRRAGGFSVETLEKFGVEEKYVSRFSDLIEKCVYGGYELNESEKSYVCDFIERSASALTSASGKARALYYKYWICVGL